VNLSSLEVLMACRCKDREGTFMVETTAWEGEKKIG